MLKFFDVELFAHVSEEGRARAQGSAQETADFPDVLGGVLARRGAQDTADHPFPRYSYGFYIRPQDV